MATQQEVMKKFVASLDKTQLRGTAAVDEAIKACSSFTSYDELIKRFLADRNNSASGEDFLKNYCGIILDNEDTGAITGSDAGGSQTKTAESVVPENSGVKSIYPPSNSFSYKGLTVNVPNASNLNDAQKNIVAGLYTWWLKAGLDLIEQTYGISFSDNDTICKKINVSFDMGSNSNLTYVWNWGSSVATIHINSSLYQNLQNSDANGAGDLPSTPNLDRIITYGLSRPLMRAKINYEDYLPSVIGKGISVLIDGYDDKGKNEILELVNNLNKMSRYSISNNRLDTGIHDEDDYDFAMGYMLLRYLAKQTVEPTNVGDTVIPANAFEYNGHSYYIYSGVTQTWEGAQEYCKSLGGHLAVINDAAENTALFNYMKSSGYSSAYFGLSDAESEGSWKWIDGTATTYTNWAGGEPNNEGENEDYAEFYYKFTDGTWNDGNFKHGTGNDTNTFICEWDSVNEDDEIEIDEATTLEVISLFQNMDASSKKTTLEENLKTLRSLKSLVEGTKDVEIVDEQEDGSEEIHFTDSKNFTELIKSYYDDDAPPLINEYTKYLHDSKGHIVYKRKYARDSAGKIRRDASGTPVRVYELDASGKKIPIENNSAEREFMGSALGTFADVLSICDSIEKIFTSKGVERTAEIANLSSSVTSFIGNIRSLKGFDKAGIIAPIASSILGLAGSIISLTDGIEAKEITDVVQKTLQSATITAKYVLKPKFLDTKIGQILNKSRSILNGDSWWTKIKPSAEKLNASALKINLTAAVALGIVMGGVQYFKSAEQYQNDGLKDSLATKNQWIDSLTAGIKTFYSTISLGLDDALWGFLSSKVQGINGKNYAEIFGDFLKLFISNQYTGSDGDDPMVNTKDGRNIYGGAGNDSICNQASKNNIYGGIGEDLILCTEGTSGQYIDGGNGNDQIALYGSSNEIHGGLGDDQIDIFGDSKNPPGGNYILGEAGNDYIWIGDSKSKKKSNVANSIDGGAGDDVIFIDQTRTSNIIFYSSGDGDDEIFGYDSNDQIRINKSNYTTQLDGDDVKIIVGSGSMILYDAKDKKLNIVETDIDIMPSGVTADKNKVTLTLSNKFKAQNIYLENYAKTFTKINASKANEGLEIVGNDSGNSIKGGKGADTISGGTGNDTVSLGGGNDVYIYSGGNDLIQDYTAGQDKIKLSGASITSASLSSSNVVLTTNKGKLTVKNGKNKNITVIDSNGNETTNIYPISTLPAGISIKSATLTATSAFTGSTIDLSSYASTVTKVNATALTRTIKIVGNAKANSLKGGSGADTIDGGSGNDTIYGGNGNDKIYGSAGNDKLYGEAGADTLYGGAGNDTLTGGAGNDVFVYEGGKDVITDYAAGDKIKITKGTISKTAYSGNNVIFTIGNGTLTVKNGKNKSITITDANNNTTTQKYSNLASSADLFEDDNFISSSARIEDISEITADNYSVTEIQSANFETLAQENKFTATFNSHETK